MHLGQKALLVKGTAIKHVIMAQLSFDIDHLAFTDGSTRGLLISTKIEFGNKYELKTSD